MTAQRNKVSTYLGKRAFYTKDMTKRRVASQLDRELPPRCTHCRLPGTIMRDGAPHCEKYHALECDCGVNDEEDSGDRA